MQSMHIGFNTIKLSGVIQCCDMAGEHSGVRMDPAVPQSFVEKRVRIRCQTGVTITRSG